MSKKVLITTISLVVVLSVLLSILIAVIFSVGKAALPADTSAANWAYSVRGEKGNFTYWFFRIITEMGYTYFVVGFIIILGIIWKFKAKTWFLGIPVLIAWLLHKLLKLIVARPRPDMSMWWMTESSTSFPSGHTNTATCLFVLLIFFVLISPADATIDIFLAFCINFLKY